MRALQHVAEQRPQPLPHLPPGGDPGVLQLGAGGPHPGHPGLHPSHPITICKAGAGRQQTAALPDGAARGDTVRHWTELSLSKSRMITQELSQSETI